MATTSHLAGGETETREGMEIMEMLGRVKSMPVCFHFRPLFSLSSHLSSVSLSKSKEE
jgi:hypothetical protein